MSVEIQAIAFAGEIEPGQDLVALVVDGAPTLQDGDIVVITHKAVSKAEGRIVDLEDVWPSARAVELAGADGDARMVELILRESRAILRHRGPLLIVETHHGYVCANAGIDRSNAPRPGAVVLLPIDPDASAFRLRSGLAARVGARVGVVVADTMGRAWREGIVGTAIGASGLQPLRPMLGELDPNGYELSSTVVAIADELAAAADLVLGKLDRIPAVLIRGVSAPGDGSARQLVREAALDLFR